MSRSTSAKVLLSLCVFWGLGAVFAPRVLACPLCFASSDSRVLHAFYASTVVLTLLPLALVAALIVYVVRRERVRQAGPWAPAAAGQCLNAGTGESAADELSARQ